MLHRARTLLHARAILTVLGALTLFFTSSRAVAEGPPAAERPFERAIARPPRWMVGVVFERGLHTISERALADDQLFGLSVTRWLDRFGLHGRIMLSPNFQDVVNTRAFIGTNLRARQRLFGIETFFGVGTHAEVRLRTHYWLAYVTPAELGVTLFTKGSFRVELYGGARAVVGGSLVDHFLIDPNGVDNVAAQEALAAEKRRPWEGYLSLVLGRAM